MNRKISVGMAVTIVILAMTVTFSVTMLIAMRLFDSTVSSVKEKESMYNKVAEVDRYVRSNDYYTIDETVLYDRLTAGYLLGTGDKYARYYTANAYTELMNQQSGKVMGIGVELWCGCFSTNLFTNGDNGGVVVKLKDSNEFADLGMVNYICGNAHIFRNYFFRGWCLLGKRDGLDTEWNLGHCRDFCAKDIGLDEEEERTAIIVPQFYNVEDAKNWLIEMFNGLKKRLDGQKKTEDE